MNSYYSQENHGPFEQSIIGDLVLENGGDLRNCTLAYSAHGQLNADKSNAILILTWYSGTSKILVDNYVGSGRALDPEKYFVLIVNQIGSGLSTSPNNYSATSTEPDFPAITIGDDVRAQHRLVTQTFGIERFALVVGASMGAQQAYEWAVRYPEMVLRLACIAGTARTTSYVAFIADAMNAAIKADPGWNNGRYASPAEVSEGLRQQARLWSLLGFSSEFFDKRAWMDVGYASAHEAMVGLLETETLLMDPNCCLLYTSPSPRDS